MEKKKRRSSILLINNNSKTRNTLSTSLIMQGYVVEAATSGFHALHLLEKESYSLIISSSNMQDMALAEIISLIRTTSSIPILHVMEKENMSNAELWKEAYGAGASDCLVDPQNVKSYLDKINSLITKTKN